MCIREVLEAAAWLRGDFHLINGQIDKNQIGYAIYKCESPVMITLMINVAVIDSFWGSISYYHSIQYTALWFRMKPFRSENKKMQNCPDFEKNYIFHIYIIWTVHINHSNSHMSEVIGSV